MLAFFRILSFVGSVGLVAGGVGMALAQSSTTHTTHAHSAVAKGNAEDGQAVFQHNCVMCHSVQPGVKIVGPSLAGVMKGPHAKTTHEVTGIILNGKGKMPAMREKVSDKDLTDLLAYLKTL